jgi:environmental stress-induced protein Ves
MTELRRVAAEVRLLRAADRVATPWKNGGGVTREVYQGSRAAQSGDFDWRVSIAEVAQPGPFSKFSGYRRLIALIEGRGMELRGAPGETTALSLRNVHAFDGNADVSGVLPFGPVSDLNVIYRPDAFSASLRFSDREERLDTGRGNVSILINVQHRAIECASGDNAIALQYLDAVLVADTFLTRAAGGTCAVIELIKGNR